MCIADYRISRYVKSVTTPITGLATGSPIMIPPNKQRVGIEFFLYPVGGIIQLIVGRVFNPIITIPALTFAHIKFAFLTDGDTPQLGFQIFVGALTTLNGGYIERFLPESVLESELSKLEK